MMHWFKQHLNWTYILLILCLNVILTPIMTLGLNYGLDWIVYAWAPILIIGGIGIATWVIKQKNRSLWHLLLYFIGILPIVILFLENRSGDQNKVR